MSSRVRSARTPFGLLLLGLGLLLVAAPLPAQLGGLVKKAKEKVAPAAGVQASTDQPARMPAPEATPQSIEQLLTGLKAEKGVLDQEAEAARRRQEAEERNRRAERAAEENQSCVETRMKADPDYAKMEQLSKDAQTAVGAGDTQKATDIAMRLPAMMQGIQQRAQTACAAPAPAGNVSSADAAAIQGAAGDPGESGAKAAGMTVVEYGQLKELIYTYFTYPKRAGLSDSEKRAIDAKRTELQAGLKAIGMLGS